MAPHFPVLGNPGAFRAGKLLAMPREKQRISTFHSRARQTFLPEAGKLGAFTGQGREGVGNDRSVSSKSRDRNPRGGPRARARTLRAP
eukprot:7902079-Pyramimonas_sp.AAC.1